MTKLLNGGRTGLSVGTLFKLEDGVTTWVECLDGALWISQVTEPRDVVLVAGEGLSLKAPRHAIVGAINGAAVVRIGEYADL